MNHPGTLEWLYIAVLFPIGLVVGSFLNVVIYRVPLGISVVTPPSSCPSCGARIRPRDNVPVLGWLLLEGKCRACRSPISVRYPLVELANGILWGLVAWRLAGLERGFAADVFTGLVELAFVSAMVVTFLVDWDHLIILDEISLGGLATAVLASVFLPELHHAESAVAFAEYHPVMHGVLGDLPPWLASACVSLFGAGVGLGFSLFIYFAGSYAFRKQIARAQQDDPEMDSALGLGDVKLMACFGAFFGWEGVLFIYIAGSVLGAFAGSVMKYLSGDAGGATGWNGFVARWRSGGSVLPFGPFLVVGALVFFFLGDPLVAAAKAALTPQ